MIAAGTAVVVYDEITKTKRREIVAAVRADDTVELQSGAVVPDYRVYPIKPLSRQPASTAPWSTTMYYEYRRMPDAAVELRLDYLFELVRNDMIARGVEHQAAARTAWTVERIVLPYLLYKHRQYVRGVGLRPARWRQRSVVRRLPRRPEPTPGEARCACVRQESIKPLSSHVQAPLVGVFSGPTSTGAKCTARHSYRSGFCKRGHPRPSGTHCQQCVRDLRPWINACRRARNPQLTEQQRIARNLRCRLHELTRGRRGSGVRVSSRGINWQAILDHLGPCPGPRSEWHVDHIKPLAMFDLTDRDQLLEAFAPANHQWLPARENVRKGSAWGGVRHVRRFGRRAAP